MFGKKARTVELDALPADEWRRRLDVAIDGLIDHEQRERDLRVQDIEYATIADIVGRVKEAMPGRSS